MRKSIVLNVLFFSVIFHWNYAQAQQYTISGYVTDTLTGETLIGANIFLAANPNTGTVSNTYGFYSITLPAGEHGISFSYLGFQKKNITVSLQQNVTLNVQLSEGIEMKEVIVEAKTEEEDDNVGSTSMGRVTLPV